MLAARLVVDWHVPIAVVRILVIVEVGRQTNIDPAKRVDHVAKRFEVDRDVAVEVKACDLADLMLCGISAAMGSGELWRDTANDVHIRYLIRRVDLLRPDPV